MKQSRRLAMLLAFFIISVCFPGRIASRNTSYVAEPYTFGVVPQFEQRKLHAIWKPIINELEKRTGLSFKGAALMMRAELERLHHATVKPIYVKSHSSVYLHVVQGLAVAEGGGNCGWWS